MKKVIGCLKTKTARNKKKGEFYSHLPYTEGKVSIILIILLFFNTLLICMFNKRHGIIPKVLRSVLKPLSFVF